MFFLKTLFILIVTVPILCTTTSIFWALKQVVRLILKFKHGPRFRGLVQGPDRIWLFSEKSHPIINIMMRFKYPNGDFYKNTAKAIENFSQKPECWKMRCKPFKFFGYDYLLDSNESPSSNIHVLNELSYQSEKSFMESMEIFGNTPISKGFLWEIHMGKKSVSWGEKNCYFCIVRFHHCLGDGSTLLNMLKDTFPSQSETLNDMEMFKEKSDDDFVQKLVKISIRFVHFFIVLWKLPEIFVKRWSKAGSYRNLNERELCGWKTYNWKIEKDYKMINKVKTIKRKLNVGFFAVIASAFGYAICNEKLLKEKNLKLVMKAFPVSKIFGQLHFTNRFSQGILDLPLEQLPYDEKQRFSQRCLKTHENYLKLLKSQEFQANYWFLQILGDVLPDYILSRCSLSSHQHSAVISNVPGPRKIHLHCGNSIEDIVFWIPHPQEKPTGIGISIFSYDSRLQLGITMDKCCECSNKEKSRLILDDVINYVDYLYDELLDLG